VNAAEPGSARHGAGLSLASNVHHLDPALAVFAGMISGWEQQQRSRFLRTETIEQRVAVVRRFAVFTDLYPWQWTPAEAEAWFAKMSSKDSQAKAFSTVRGYQLILRSFCDYLTDQRYGWVAQCVERFGAPPTQILHEWNNGRLCK
jgi:hypothetical protein